MDEGVYGRYVMAAMGGRDTQIIGRGRLVGFRLGEGFEDLHGFVPLAMVKRIETLLESGFRRRGRPLVLGLGQGSQQEEKKRDREQSVRRFHVATCYASFV